MKKEGSLLVRALSSLFIQISTELILSGSQYYRDLGIQGAAVGVMGLKG